MEELNIGFRFYPTEEELVSFYLRNKLDGQREDMQRFIPVTGIYSLEPWQLPDRAGEVPRGDTEQWFFFTQRQEREARGGRPSRTTATGYWKSTGSPSYVYSSDNRVIGMKKTMVFYKGNAPSGRKTKWKMHEYRAIEAAANPTDTSPPKLRHEFTLCRVYVISGSFRAFDRRPQEAVSRRPPLPADGAATSSQIATMMERTSSSSGASITKVDNSDLPETGDEGNIWEMVDDLKQPSWGWEELHWP